MSWKTRGTNSVTGSTTWSNSDPFAASVINDIDDDLRTWGANVDAAGHRLTNCAGVDGPTGANPLTFSTNGAERMRITSDGKMGLGIIPLYELHIGGGGGTSLQNVAGIYCNPNATIVQMSAETSGGIEGGVMCHSAGKVYMGAWSNHALVLRTNNADALTVSAAGVVKLHSTPVYADNTAALAGGLTAGMQYRTSTGARMEVY